MNPKHTEVALVNGQLEQLRPPTNDYSCGNEIRVTIAVLEEGKPHPRNWSLSSCDNPRKSFGGCFARIYASKDFGSIFSLYGPEITYGDLRDYHHGAAALKAIGARLEKLRLTRGPAVDPADDMGRWLEACGVKQVWFRPDHSKHESWLHKGDWSARNLGDFVYLVRTLLFAAPVKTETPEPALA